MRPTFWARFAPAAICGAGPLRASQLASLASDVLLAFEEGREGPRTLLGQEEIAKCLDSTANGILTMCLELRPDAMGRGRPHKLLRPQPE